MEMMSTPMPTMQQISQMQDTILDRYTEHARELPRRETTDPYEILVSEVMSQQTQVSRVIPKYHALLHKAPTVYELAQLDKPTLLRLRSGLGYNNRALRLQRTAQIIVDEHDGQFPQDEKALLALPGIGPYTAHALMAFSRNMQVPVLDINIRRVLVTMLGLPSDISDRDLRQVAIICIPPNRSREWHNALMDYGAMVLTAKKT
jgi:A/G-specific adenine glycosylase